MNKFTTAFSNRKTRRLGAFFWLTSFLFLISFNQIFSQSTVTVRFANPVLDCATGEYCVDVEFQSDVPDDEVFGMNVRFFYDSEQLLFDAITDFQGGYTAVSPNPPLVNTGGASSGNAFGFGGPATFVNGAIQLTNTGATPILLTTDGWTKLYQICFTITAPNSELDNFCPSLVWDLEQNPANGGFFPTSDGVVITTVDNSPGQESQPADENVDQFNWEYIGPGTPPYGQAIEEECIVGRCIDLSLDASVDNDMPIVGEQVVFTLDLTNNGPDTASNVIVTSLLPSGFTYVSDDGGLSYDEVTGEWTIASLDPGETITLNITATVNAMGVYTLLAEVTTAIGNDPDSTPNNGVDTDMDTIVEDDPGDEDDGDGVVVDAQVADISLLKEAMLDLGPDAMLNAGDVITYTFTVTNTGDVPLTNVTISDPMVTVMGGPIATLAPGATDNTTFTASYTVMQSDIDAGMFTNSATVMSSDPNGDPVTDVSDDPNDPTDVDPDMDGDPDDPTVVTLTQDPNLAVQKTGTFNDENSDGFAQVGETISYTFSVTNNGNVTITNISITDPIVTVMGGPIATLAPGDTDNSTFTASYTITQMDIDAGVVTNIATATGTDPNGDPVMDDSDDPTDVTDVDNDGDGDPEDPTNTPTPQDSNLALEKTGTFNDENSDGFAQVGETISYTFSVTNNGNTTITNISISDPIVTVMGGPIATLAPGDTDNTTFTASYTITQADIDAGVVTNIATATGTDPNGDPVMDDSDDPTDVTDVDNDGDGDPEDPTDTPTPQDSNLALEKTGTFNDENSDGFAQVGETISYTFSVLNNGNTTITNITITDPIVTVMGGPIASLAPGDTDNTTFTATYTITQADIDAGSVTNIATATGTDPNGDPVMDDSDDPTDVTDVDNDGDGDPEDPTVTDTPQNPNLAVEKTGTFNDENSDGFGQVGETISYTFSVTNNGNVTITNISITDPIVTVMGGPIATLASGDTDNSTFTATYTITQADIDAGVVTNIATATGTDPNGDPVMDDSDDPTDVTDVDNDGDGDPEDPTDTPTNQNANLALEKTGTFNDENSDGFAQVGETISYTFSVTNNGNVTITNISITDPIVTVMGGPIATLAPGATDNSTFTATYTISQADIDAGSVTNIATATGTDPNGDPVMDDSDDPTNLTDVDDDGDGDPEDPTDTPTPQDSNLAVEKTGTFNDENNDGFAQVGETISYTFSVMNNGNTTITNITLTDPVVTVMGGPIATLAPGDTDNTTFTATYTISQADIDAGSVTNIATATGTDPNGDPVMDDSDDPTDVTDVDNDGDGDPEDPTVTDTPQNPNLALEKTGTLTDENNDGIIQAGETITYTFSVTNNGNVTITNLSITDPVVTVVGGPLATLAPGDTDNMTFTATYTISQADIDAGMVTNTATANGTDPNGDPVMDDSDDPTDLTDVDNDGDGDPEDPTVTTIDAVPQLQVTKVGVVDLGANGGLDPGDVINYDLVVTNTGNVTITGISLTDPNADLGSISCTPMTAFDLDPGASATCTAVHTITQADIDLGTVTNTATASGTDPNGDPVTDDSDDPNDPTDIDPDMDGEPDDPTVTDLPCVELELWVYLEGGAIATDGSQNYSVPMRTTMNTVKTLPGQTYNDPFSGPNYTSAGQPYSVAPWNYMGTEGDNYDSEGMVANGDAGYPATVVDWVLVSLRETADGSGGPICQAAALLHGDGRIEFIDGFDCCDVDLGQSYYVVVEHRNHLIVMSHEPVPIVSNTITYDFRSQESYIDDPFEFGIFVGQKEIMPGVFSMFAGNGNQAGSSNSDTDVNFDDRSYWEEQNGTIGQYRNGDYNLNGDTNFNDRTVWEFNNSNFTSVPRN